MSNIRVVRSACKSGELYLRTRPPTALFEDNEYMAEVRKR